MKYEFLNKINNNEYISMKLYEYIKENNKELIPKDFDIDLYNDKVLDKEYIKYKDYFDNMYKGIDNNIHLDVEQIKSILADEDYSLIIAGAGTGKTTTMASKVKYLVDIKKVNPSEILVMSFTKKATQELEQRIIVDFNINCSVTTFHSLGYNYLKHINTSKKVYIVSDNDKNNIFLEYIRKTFKDKQKIKDILDIFPSNKIGRNNIFSSFFKENYLKYDTYDDYMNAYKEKKYSEINNIDYHIDGILDKRYNQEYIYTIKNELVKSKGEAIIANYLYMHSIDYKYEKVYEELLDNNRIYKPDFTLELGGEKIYIEYFGLSSYEKIDRYEKIKQMKEDYIEKHHLKVIKLDYDKDEILLDKLYKELTRFGFKIKIRNSKEVFFELMNNNQLSDLYNLKNFYFDVIDGIKNSNERDNYKKVISNYLINYSDKEIKLKQCEYIFDFYNYYNSKIITPDMIGVDFSDMIYYAIKYISKINSEDLKYKYIIIDEYQDISSRRYAFTKEIIDKNDAKIVAVGDDWQSIFAFSGSNIEYIYDFENYFQNAKLLKITKTYRNSQNLIEYTRDFIMKNKSQIDKELISNKNLENPIKFEYYKVPECDKKEYNSLNRISESKKIKEVILKIHELNPDHKILILARNNDMIDKMIRDCNFKDDIDTKVTFKSHKDIIMDAMTIHKSKGLTSDEVILFGLNNKFPSQDRDEFWLIDIFKNKRKNESISHAEERRLFYVALTRTKNNVYLIVNEDNKYNSEFVSEIKSIILNS